MDLFPESILLHLSVCLFVCQYHTALIAKVCNIVGNVHTRSSLLLCATGSRNGLQKVNFEIKLSNPIFLWQLQQKVLPKVC